MGRRAVSEVTLALLFMGVLTLPFSIQLVEASEVHDVAVTAVETFITICDKTYPINIVFEGRSININATVENQGDFTETFNVTAKYEGNTIQTTTIPLTAHTSTTVTFTWDTTGVAKGTYTISVEASMVQGETNTTDNTFIDGTVTVTLLGDFDGDGDIDEDDLWKFCEVIILYYIYPPPERTLDPRCDLDEDGDIDEDDLWDFCEEFIAYWKKLT